MARSSRSSWFRDRSRAKKGRYPSCGRYSEKHWDRDERPLKLAGSFFDANSLGKWMYDWVVYFYGSEDDTANLAGDMWLTMIRFSGELTILGKKTGGRRGDAMVIWEHDLIRSKGEVLWLELVKLIAWCEKPLIEILRAEGVQNRAVEAGKMFVEIFFCEVGHRAMVEDWLGEADRWQHEVEGHVGQCE